jgi:hypothetical protein
MFNLEQSIAEWRKSMRRASRIAPETLDELESHLRETVEELARSGIAETQAFQSAVTRLGPAEAVTSEFQKLRGFTWLPAIAVTGIGIVAALLFAAYLISLIRVPGPGILFFAYVFAIALGYGSTLLLGVLGMCFVCQRSAAEFSPSRLRSVSRVSFGYGLAAALFLAGGMILGLIWSHWHWGDYWRWDSPLVVLVWLTGFLVAHHSPRVTSRSLLVSSLLGSNIVILAWLARYLFPSGPHSYGIPSWFTSSLGVALIANLAFFMIGLAPAGWLRLRKA